MDALRAGALRDVPVAVLGFARSGIALARFLADQGATVTVYDGRPADVLSEAIAALEGRPVTLALGPEVDPATVLVGCGAGDHIAVDQPGLPDDRAAAASGAGEPRCGPGGR